MTVASSLATITASIAGLTISGVTVKDIGAIPESGNMITPVLFPQPSGFLDGVKVTFETFGSNAGAKLNLEYNLHYVYLHTRAGAGMSQFDGYSGLMTNLAAIMAAIMSNDAINGLIDLQLSDIGSIGIISDPAGNDFWGLLLDLHVLEFAK